MARRVNLKFEIHPTGFKIVNEDNKQVTVFFKKGNEWEYSEYPDALLSPTNSAATFLQILQNPAELAQFWHDFFKVDRFLAKGRAEFTFDFDNTNNPCPDPKDFLKKFEAINKQIKAWNCIYQNIADTSDNALRYSSYNNYYARGWHYNNVRSVKRDGGKYPQVSCFTHHPGERIHQLCEGPIWDHDPEHLKIGQNFFDSLEDVEDILSIGKPYDGGKGYLNYFNYRQMGARNDANHPLVKARVKKASRIPEENSTHISDYEVVLKNDRTVRVHHIPEFADFGAMTFDPSDVKKLLHLHESCHKLRIHCSAGLGRSGVLELAYTLLDHFDDVFPSGQDANIEFAMHQLEKLRFDRPGLIQTPDQFRMALLLTLQLKHVKQSQDFAADTRNWEAWIDQMAQRYEFKIANSTPENLTLFTEERLEPLKLYDEKMKKIKEQEGAEPKLKSEKLDEDQLWTKMMFFKENLDSMAADYSNPEKVGAWSARKNRIKNSFGYYLGDPNIGAIGIRDHIEEIVYGAGENKQKLIDVFTILLKRVAVFVEHHTNAHATDKDNKKILNNLLLNLERNPRNEKNHLVVREVVRLLKEIKGTKGILSPEENKLYSVALHEAVKNMPKHEATRCKGLIQHVVSVFEQPQREQGFKPRRLKA